MGGGDSFAAVSLRDVISIAAYIQQAVHVFHNCITFKVEKLNMFIFIQAIDFNK